MPALEAGWPIIIVFLSVIGLALYFWSCRPPGIGTEHGEAVKRRHHDYVSADWKKVVGSIIHRVGGDGPGIISAMVVTRADCNTYGCRPSTIPGYGGILGICCPRTLCGSGADVSSKSLDGENRMEAREHESAMRSQTLR